jgi:hypothetical protein
MPAAARRVDESGARLRELLDHAVELGASRMPTSSLRPSPELDAAREIVAVPMSTA